MYWIKGYGVTDYIFSYDGEHKFNYEITKWEGPYETIEEVRDEIRACQMDDAKVVYFEEKDKD
jgi:hypothetical protein